MSHFVRTALFAATASLAAGCSSDYSGVDYANLSVRVAAAPGAPAAPPPPACFTLPVLVGGLAEKVVEVDGVLSIRLLLTDTEARASFEGDDGTAPDVTITADSLRGGPTPFAQEVPVRSAAGVAYTVTFGAKCEASE